MVAVLGLGVGALLVDRVLLGGEQSGPERAEAASPAYVEKTAPAASLATRSGAMSATALADRLDAVRQMLDLDLAATKDAFCPSEVWMAELRPEALEVKPVRTEVSHERKSIEFGRTHQLKAVVSGGVNGGAFIGDKYLRVGQVIDGFRLVKISHRAAVLESDGVEVELKLKVDSQDR